MRGRQLPQVDPHAASMGCPQLGQACSSILADVAAMEALPSSAGDSFPALLQAR
jgi:hypothetical protein